MSFFRGIASRVAGSSAPSPEPVSNEPKAQSSAQSSIKGRKVDSPQNLRNVNSVAQAQAIWNQNVVVKSADSLEANYMILKHLLSTKKFSDEEVVGFISQNISIGGGIWKSLVAQHSFDSRPEIRKLFENAINPSAALLVSQDVDEEDLDQAPVSASPALPAAPTSSASPSSSATASTVVVAPAGPEDGVAPSDNAAPMLLPYEGPEPKTIEEYGNALQKISAFYKTRPEELGRHRVTYDGVVYAFTQGQNGSGRYLEFLPERPHTSYRYSPDRNPQLSVGIRPNDWKLDHFENRELKGKDEMLILELMRQAFKASMQPLPVLRVMKDAEQCKQDLLEKHPWFASPNSVPNEGLLGELAANVRSSSGVMSPQRTLDAASAVPLQPMSSVARPLDHVYYLRSELGRQQAQKELYETFSPILKGWGETPIDLSAVLVSYKGEKLTLRLDSNGNLKIRGIDVKDDNKFWELTMAPDGSILDGGERSGLVTGMMTLLYLEKESIAQYMTNPVRYATTTLQQTFSLAQMATRIKEIPGVNAEPVASSAVAPSAAGSNNASQTVSLSNIRSTMVAADSMLKWTIKTDSDGSVTFNSTKTNAEGWGRLGGSTSSRKCELRWNASTGQMEVNIERGEASRFTDRVRKENKYILSFDGGNVRVQFRDSTTKIDHPVSTYNGDGTVTYTGNIEDQQLPNKELSEDISLLCRTWHTLSGVLEDPLATVSDTSKTDAYESKFGSTSNTAWDVETRFLNGERAPDGVLMAIMKYREQDLKGMKLEGYPEFSPTLPEPSVAVSEVPSGRRRG